jgi:DNA polymerase III subunit alpha
MLEEAAKSGDCGLMTVELDRQPGEETPRVTVKRIQRFEALASNARLKADVTVSDVAALPMLSALMAGERGGRGELVLHAVLSEGRTGTVLLGRDFALDAELAARIEAVPGVDSVHLGTAGPKLALVS